MFNHHPRQPRFKTNGAANDKIETKAAMEGSRHYLDWMLFVLVLMAALLGALIAKADTLDPKSRAMAESGLQLAVSCDGPMAVFQVVNRENRWTEPGAIKVVDSASGKVLRQRTMRLAGGQAASFRLPADVASARLFRLVVEEPGQTGTRELPFSGPCEQTRMVRR